SSTAIRTATACRSCIDQIIKNRDLASEHALIDRLDLRMLVAVGGAQAAKHGLGGVAGGCLVVLYVMRFVVQVHGILVGPDWPLMLLILRVESLPSLKVRAARSQRCQ